MKFDMHCHTTRSDGTSTPEQLIDVAKQRWLEMLFITDHDRDSSDIVPLIQEAWIQSTPSVEISTTNKIWDDRSLHATYYTSEVSDNIKDIINHTKSQKMELILSQLYYLEEKWFFIDVEDFYSFITEASGRSKDGINKYDLASYITSQKENKEVLQEILWEDISTLNFYKRCMKRDGDLYDQYGKEIQEYEPAISDVAEIAKDEWILSIAHPNFTFSRDGIRWFRELYEEIYKPFGIHAVEINGKASRKWVEAILDMKNKYGDDLQLTFGSDCHNIWRPDDKHEDLWVQNQYVPVEIMEGEMNVFREKIWLL